MATLCTVRVGDKYGPEYGRAFRAQAARDGMDVVILGEDVPQQWPQWHGWWSKLELFSPAWEKYRPLVFIDLDTFLMRTVRPLLEWADLVSEFWALREWSPGPDDRVQSSVMVLPKDVDAIWWKWQREGPQWLEDPKGDQAFLRTVDWRALQDKFPGLCGSYKWKNKDAPLDVLVTFHGKPKPHEVADGWAAEWWARWT